MCFASVKKTDLNPFQLGAGIELIAKVACSKPDNSEYRFRAWSVGKEGSAPFTHPITEKIGAS